MLPGAFLHFENADLTGTELHHKLLKDKIPTRNIFMYDNGINIASFVFDVYYSRLLLNLDKMLYIWTQNKSLYMCININELSSSNSLNFKIPS